jgi:hypothetical protein
MRTFAQKQKAAQQTKSAISARLDRALFGRNPNVHSILHLQRTIENQAERRVLKANTEDVKRDSGTTEIVRFGHDFSRIPIHTPAAGAIQTRLAINKPGDEYEQEADRIAEQMMRMVEPTPIGSAPVAIQRKCAGCEDEEENAVPTERVPAVVTQPPSKAAMTRPGALQGVEGEEEEYPPVSQAVVFRKAEFATPLTTAESVAAITDRLGGCRAGGEALPALTCQRMENAFGYDFSRVRVHRDAEAGEMSRQLSALAFTYGSHIYFGNGMYDPDGSSGKRLLAHELTHVVQQGQAVRQVRSGATGPATVGHDTSGAANRTSTPMIQRTATWGAGAVHESNNLAPRS